MKSTVLRGAKLIDTDEIIAAEADYHTGNSLASKARLTVKELGQKFTITVRMDMIEFVNWLFSEEAR